MRESFIPILAVLGLLFLLLLYARYEVALEADAVTLIEIQAPLADDGDSDMAGQDLAAFGAADGVLEEVSALIAKHKWQQAEQRLQRLTRERDDSPSWSVFGMLRYQQQRYDEALQMLETAAQRQPLWPGLYFYRALVNTRLDATAEAAADYRRLIAINPNHFEAHYNLGLLLLRQHEFVQAEQVFRQAAGMAGGERRARAHYQWGRAMVEQGEPKRIQAIEQFNLAIRHLPAFIAPRLALARMEPKTDEGMKAAEQQLLKAQELAPGNPSVLFAMAQHFSDAGKRGEAIVKYRELLQFEPEHSAGHYNLGLLLLDADRWQEAKEQFDWILQREPQNTRALFNRGRAGYRLEQYEAAIADYRQALALQNGNYPEALLNIGLVQTALKDYTAAEKSYRQAVSQRDDYATAWYNLGLLHMRQKQSAQAVAAFNRAVSLNGNYVRAWYNLGVLYGREGENEKAISAYEEALRQRPDYANARLNLAVRWMRLGQPQKAIEHYRKALSYDDTYSSAWNNLALAYMEQHQYSDARDALQKVLELEPDNVKAMQLMADTLASLEQHEEAVTVLEQAVDIEADSTELRLALAQNLRASGKYQQARSEIFKGLSLNPEDQHLRHELASLESELITTKGSMQ